MKDSNKLSILNQFLKQITEIFNSRSGQFALIIVLFTLYFSPYLINGQDSYIMPHDNLDQCNMIGIYDGTFNGSFFPSEEMEEYNLPGIQPIFRIVRLSFDKLFFHTFGYFWGFVVNELIYRILAFIGMFLLMKRIKNILQFPDILLILLAFSFASLPFWPQGNASVAGIPLLVVALHNLYLNKHYILSFLFILFFGFYSSLILSGIFIGIIIIISFSFLLMKGKLNLPLFFGALSLLVCWIISHYGLFWHQFVEQIPNSRSEYIVFTGGFDRFLNEMFKLFLNGQYHAHSKHKFIILPSLVFISIFYFRHFRFKKWFLLGLGYLFFSAITYGLWYFTPISEYYTSMDFGFKWSRFFFINPPVWYVLWGIALIYFFNVFKNNKIGMFIISFLLFLQIGYNSSRYTLRAYTFKPTFREFFSEQQFDEIEEELMLDKNHLRIGCIGFFPSVANYNGFKTLGAYIGIYPLDFKQKLYKIIKGELDQNRHIEKYFLRHGFRVYLFDDKIAKRYGDQEYIKKNIPEITCELDIEEIKKFGVTHIFSVSKITNNEEKNLRLVYISDKPKYLYRLYVYEIL